MTIFATASRQPLVVDLTASDAITGILERYSPNQPMQKRGPLGRVLSYALSAGANTLLIEPGYIDRDWRSEHSGFYSKGFREFSSVVDRLHFLALHDGETYEQIHERLDQAQYQYVGYSVMRPLEWAPVGRTVLRASPPLVGKLMCVARDRVHLYGTDLTVTGAPFISQDYQLTRCAHAVAWQSGYLHHLRFQTPRSTSAHIAELAMSDSSESRVTPSNGLVRTQLGSVLSNIGIGPIVYNAASGTSGKDTVARVIERYLDSGLPVIAANDRHSVLVIGYYGKRGSREYLFHDDERGIYLDTGISGVDAGRPWTRLIVPAPSKLYLPAEQAEDLGKYLVDVVAANERSSLSLRQLSSRVNRAGWKNLGVKCVAVESNNYKALLATRGLPRDLVVNYRTVQMPRWLWVFEVRDGTELLTEILIDATSNPRSRSALAWLVDGELMYFDRYPGGEILRLEFGQGTLGLAKPIARPLTTEEVEHG